MTRYIDADELKDWSEIVPLTGDGGIDINDFDEKLKSMPTIDAVPVIRCKDCKWYEFDRKMHCGLPHGVRSKDDYCSDAERKEECGQRSAD